MQKNRRDLKGDRFREGAMTWHRYFDRLLIALGIGCLIGASFTIFIRP